MNILHRKHTHIYFVLKQLYKSSLIVDLFNLQENHTRKKKKEVPIYKNYTKLVNANKPHKMWFPLFYILFS